MLYSVVNSSHPSVLYIHHVEMFQTKATGHTNIHFVTNPLHWAVLHEF